MGIDRRSVRALVDSRPYHGDFVRATIIRLCTGLRSLAVNAELLIRTDEQGNWLEDIIKDSVLLRSRDTQLPLPRLNKLTTLGVQHDRNPNFLSEASSGGYEDTTWYGDESQSNMSDAPEVEHNMSDTLANALYLPSLTDLRMARVRHVGDWTNKLQAKDLLRSWALPTKLPDPVNLKTLRIQYSELQPAQIEALLRHTPQLEVFSCDFEFPHEPAHSFLQGIQEASHHVQNTLRHLVLNVGDGYDVGSLGSLKHLHKLEVLLISLPMTYDADQARLPPLAEVLPENLRVFGLSGCLMNSELFSRWKEERLLQHIREYWQRRSPKLEWIRAEIPGIHCTWVDGREICDNRMLDLFELLSEDHWEASLTKPHDHMYIPGEEY